MVVSAVLMFSAAVRSVQEFMVKIPVPSGILVERATLFNESDGQQHVHRFVRLLVNSVHTRPNWMSIKLIKGLLTVEECDLIVSSAEEFAARAAGEHVDLGMTRGSRGWQTARHASYRTTDLPFQSVFPPVAEAEVAVEGDNVVAAATQTSPGELLLGKLRKKIFRRIAKTFNVSASRIFIDDLFIAKYNSSEGEQRLLEMHTDKTPFSFVVSLSDESMYSGGGTYFFDTQELWRPPRGAAVYFSGYRPHGGKVKQSKAKHSRSEFRDHSALVTSVCLSVCPFVYISYRISHSDRS